jgi:hypothetical protein
VNVIAAEGGATSTTFALDRGRPPRRRTALHRPRAAQGPRVAFALLRADEYAIEIDPKSELWRDLGVGYVALPYEASDPEFLALARPVGKLPDVGMWIYAYRWGDDAR